MATRSNSSPSSGRGAKPKPSTKSAAKPATKKPTAKKSTRKTVGKIPEGTTRTSRNTKGTEKLPVPPDAEVKPKRNTNHQLGAIIARGRKNLMTNEQRRMLARATDGLSPIEFATSVLRDEAASQSSRQWAAEVLMPYMHHRLPTAVQVHTNNRNGGVLVAPSAMSAEEWIAQYGAQPADVVDIEFKEVGNLVGDD